MIICICLQNLNPTFPWKETSWCLFGVGKKIELVFVCQRYTEMNWGKVATTEFYDYALSWWDHLLTSRRHNDEYPVETRTEMKNIRRKRFVPSHYHHELHNKLRRLPQGSCTVEDYYQEMETLLIRDDVQENWEATMLRFLGGLHQDIQDKWRCSII